MKGKKRPRVRSAKKKPVKFCSPIEFFACHGTPGLGENIIKYLDCISQENLAKVRHSTLLGMAAGERERIRKLVANQNEIVFR